MASSIFITGAASGIGRAAALRFSAEGWLTGLYDVDAEGLAETRRQLPTDRHVTGVLDVTDADSWARAVAGFAEVTDGQMGVLLNNAGVLTFGRFDEVSPERAARMIDVNARGVVLGVYACLPLLAKTPGARIINLASASAIYGPPELAVYAATKFFVRGLTESLDLEFAPRGIRVCDVLPGFVDTPMVSSQTFRPGSLDTLGVKLTADDVARTLVKAATSGARWQPHWYPQGYQGLLARVGGMFPELARAMMKVIGRV